jgi:stage II sporulation protein D
MHRSVPTLSTRFVLAAAALLALGGCVDRTPTGPFADARDTAFRGDGAATASAFTGDIRIGVVPSATTVRVGADAAFTVVNRATGAVLVSGTGGEVRVDLLAAGTVRTRWWLQTACTGSEAIRDDWIARAEALGYETHTEFVASVPCWRLLLGSWPLEATFGARSGYRNTAIEQGLAGGDSFWRQITIVTGETQLGLTHGGEERIVADPVALSSADGLVRIDGVRYRGLAEVWTNSGGTLAAINEVPIEAYLYGVVPRELPPVPYGLPEAQKAQAVTARTYALAGIGKRHADGYDLLATTADQVYGGYDAEHAVSTAAVDATRGVVATYEGGLITTLYHSTSGGYRANSEDVFVTALPYLRGGPDAERGAAPEHAPTLEAFRRHANPVNLRAAPQGDFESDWSRYHRWVVEWTADEMVEVLRASFAAPAIGRVDQIRVTDRADHGRVRAIEFHTDAGVFTETKDRIRSRLRYVLDTGGHASLRSTLFFIEPVVDRPSGTVAGWTAYGGGWGHGVGMSQTGAVGMAERGRTFGEILRHYYRGIELETRW